MKALGIALVIIGYALFYSGASNLFTGGQGWGFLQALLNKGTANQSGSVGNLMGGSNGNSSKGSAGSAVGGALGDVLGNLLGGMGKSNGK